MGTYTQLLHTPLARNHGTSTQGCQLKKIIDNRSEVIQQKQLLDTINRGRKVAQCALLKLPNPNDPTSIWEVDTRKEGHEQIKSWIDAQNERKNYRAIIELQKQLDHIPSPNPFEIFLFEYAEAIINKSGVAKEKKTTTGQGGQIETSKGTPWLIFGVDGKDLEALKSAIRTGYRRFDCAEGYGNINNVARALIEEKVPRNEFEIIYKFELNSHEDEEETYNRLIRIVKMFGGLDVLMIHNTIDEQDCMTVAWKVMNRLKSEKLVGRIGMGNIKANQKALLENLNRSGKIDVIENSASSVLADQNLQALIQALGADFMYYDVMKLAHDTGLYQDFNSPEENNDAIKALVFKLQKISGAPNRKSNMILSSRNSGRQKNNFENFGSGDSLFQAPENYAEAERYISDWVNRKNICEADGPEVTLPPNIKEFLEQADWNSLRKNIAESKANIFAYLSDNCALSKASLDAVIIPERIGLNRRYVGWSLSDILEQLLGGVTCNHQGAQELISVLVNEKSVWSFLKDSLEKVTKL